MVENMKVITLARNQVFQTVKDMLSENGGREGFLSPQTTTRNQEARRKMNWE